MTIFDGQKSVLSNIYGSLLCKYDHSRSFVPVIGLFKILLNYHSSY